ncbi:distal membrane-arm assembly complex protein 2 [Ahaetulla prasina]|uniref:distal membrane-arm assembly complex protein 2 n=1 Tax=Ahaetulla prasina TaxID=499056 RepID=UPI0026491178|nr:distal membrane-arm assembly complex protein 2 [Ahaetulla prasina]
MAAPMLLRQSKRLTSLYDSCQFSSTSERLSSNPQKGGIFQYLSSRFYDIETFVEIGWKLKRWKMEKENKYAAKLHQNYGSDIGAAVFVLKLQGAIRFQDQMDWYRVKNPRKEESINFLDYSGKPLEAIDLSGSFLSYVGLENFVNLKGLKHLDLSRCPLVDDWCLNRLHPFGDTLQTLSLAGCPQITEGGLPCLHHFENLERLDVSNLPSVSHPLLIRILLEEMLPQCYIVGMDGQEDADSPTEREKERIFPTPSQIST